MSHKYIKQDGLKDCGVCCLYNIIKYYGGSIDIDKLRIYTKTDDNGTNVYNIILASNKLGLNAEAYKCELDDLCSLKLPIIAHMVIDNCNHFIIIDKIVDDNIIIFDPIRGILKYSMKDFVKEWTNIIITFTPTCNIVKEKEIKHTFNIYKFIKDNKIILIYFLLSSFIITLLTSLNSLFLSELYKKSTYSSKIFSYFVMLILVKITLDYIRTMKLVIFNKKIDNTITTKTLKKILFLPYKYHHDRPVGDIISRLNDLTSIKDFIFKVIFSFIIDCFFLLIFMVLVLKINYIIFYMLVCISLTYLLFHIIYRKSILSNTMILKEAQANVNSLLFESVVGIDTIKNLSIENKIYKRFKKEYNDFQIINSKLNTKYAKLNLIKNMIESLSPIILIYIGICLSEREIIPFSNLIALNSIIIYYFISLENVISIDMTLINAKESYKRLSRLLKNKEEKDKEKLDIRFSHKIDFSNVIFSYNDVNNIIENVNFSIIKNTSVFIKGKSGTGKSTLFKLLNKQLDVKDNMIFIDGIDINKISREDIKNNICYVSQNEFIFTGSILDNIKMYSNLSNEEITKAVKVSKLDEVLEKRNINLDYILKENGCNLSGGERQKILIARSLLRNKNILIFDETMNEIDSKCEKEIIENIKKHYCITLILISHKEDNSNLFDEIIEFNKKGSSI